jgi:ribose transport system permease protein
MSLGVMVIVLTLLSSYFLTYENLISIGLQMSVVAIMAIGQVMVIISGGIDLAAGSVLALAGIATTMLLNANWGIPAAVLGGLAIGTLCGLLAGALIAWGHLPPFIATLGIMGMARGLALLLTGGSPIFNLPPAFNFLGGGRLLDLIPIPIVFTIVLAVIGHIILTKMRFGRYVFAIGSNVLAARLAGIKVGTTLLKLYAINGLLCGFAGIILASRLSTGQPTAGTGYELDVIASCVIGGASLSGGEGTILGAMIGALIMGVLRNGSNLLDISAFWQQIAIGAIIIAAVLSDQYRKYKSLT